MDDPGVELASPVCVVDDRVAWSGLGWTSSVGQVEVIWSESEDLSGRV